MVVNNNKSSKTLVERINESPVVKRTKEDPIGTAFVYGGGNATYFLLAHNIVDVTRWLSEQVANLAVNFSIGAADFFGNSVVGYLQDNPDGFQTAAILAAGAGAVKYNKTILKKLSDLSLNLKQKIKGSKPLSIGRNLLMSASLIPAALGVGNAFSTSSFDDTGEKTKGGYTIFEYDGRVRPSAEIADLFDQWDEVHGDQFKNTGTKNVFYGDEGEIYVKAGSKNGSNVMPPKVIQRRGVYDKTRYQPNSPEAIALFEEAADLADVPKSWARSKGLHNILKNESGGYVGIPNYTIRTADGRRAKNNPQTWPKIHEELKSGKLKPGSHRARSSATGLGQLLLVNVERYYPSGSDGIGVPVEEAAGMLSYIKSRYGNPDKAWAKYGKIHEGY